MNGKDNSQLHEIKIKRTRKREIGQVYIYKKMRKILSKLTKKKHQSNIILANEIIIISLIIIIIIKCLPLLFCLI